jgi:long-chain fatty acid transport protein
MSNSYTPGSIVIRVLPAALLLVLAGPVAATNGYFAHGYGTKSKAMGGTGVSLSLDTLAPATNPAGLTGVDEQIDLGIAYFSPDRGYDVTGAATGACLSPQQCTFGVGPDSRRSDRDYFLIPHFGIARKWSDDVTVGIAVYGNGGMNTRYVGGSATVGAPMGTVPPGTAFTLPGTFGSGTAGVDLIQLFVAPTYARRLENGVSIGISPILAMQSFEARGLGSFAPFSSAPTKLTNNGHDRSYGLGLKLGVQVPIGESARFGASYQTKMSMSEFDSYAGLFAGQGDFDIPASATVGFSVEASDALTLAFDVEWIGYGGVDSIANPIFPNLQQAPLGSDGGAGFGWNDMTVYKLGAAWQADAQSTWRFGYSFGDQPVDSSEVLFNILAPGVVEQHFTLGYTRESEGGNSWTVAAMYAPSKSVSGINPLDPAQNIELSMDQFEFEFSYTFGR